MRLLVFATFILLGQINHVVAQERYALVIGNNNYTHARKLETAKSDAEAIAAKLQSIDFKVSLHTDVVEDDFPVVVSTFIREAKSAEAVAIYYAGHGIESEVLGGNYLVPVDAVLEREDHLESQAYPLNTLLTRLEQIPAPVRLVILDCCRNNPLEGRSWSANRGANGLASIDPQSLDSATMVVYSASPGKVAKERINSDDPNGPFATALLQELAKPGATVISTFAEVESSVSKATSQTQRPKIFFNGSIAPFNLFTFVRGTAEAVPQETVSMPSPVPSKPPVTREAPPSYQSISLGLIEVTPTTIVWSPIDGGARPKIDISMNVKTTGSSPVWVYAGNPGLHKSGYNLGTLLQQLNAHIIGDDGQRYELFAAKGFTVENNILPTEFYGTRPPTVYDSLNQYLQLEGNGDSADITITVLATGETSTPPDRVEGSISFRIVSKESDKHRDFKFQGLELRVSH